MLYLNDNRVFVINSEIVEWDIEKGNTSIMREYSLTDEDTISRIEALSKKKRLVEVGLLMKKDSKFSKGLESGFNKAVLTFMERNDLDKDYDILSIKRDAVFVVNKNIKHPLTGEHVKFRRKKTYDSYLYIKPYEFYFSKNGSIDVKGMNDSSIPLHTDGMLEFLSTYVTLSKRYLPDKSKIHAYLNNFATVYKNRELDFSYYREFNTTSAYRYCADGNIAYLESIDEELLKNVDIRHNYKNIILPVVQLTL
jgi:hypothetical protein